MASLALAVKGTMILAAMAMVFGARKCKTGAAWAHVLAVGGMVVTVGGAAWCLASSRSDGVSADTENLYRQIAGRKLGTHLAQMSPGGRALVIVDPTLPADSPAGNPLVKGLREGFGDKIAVCSEYAPKITKAELPEDGVPSSANAVTSEIAMDVALPDEWFTAEAFDQIAERFSPKVDLIVSTIGLPADLADMEFWTMEDRPKLAIVDRGAWGLERAIKAGVISAVVAGRPDADYSSRRPPSNLDTAFARRYVLVTAENVDDVASTYPQLFR